MWKCEQILVVLSSTGPAQQLWLRATKDWHHWRRGVTSGCPRGTQIAHGKAWDMGWCYLRQCSKIMLQKLGAAPSRWRRGSTVGTGPPSLTCPGGTRGVRASLCSTRQGRNLDSDKAGGRCRTALALGRVCTHVFVSGHLLEAQGPACGCWALASHPGSSALQAQ